MPEIKEILRNLTIRHRDRLEKERKIAENMIRTAEAARKAKESEEKPKA